MTREERLGLTKDLILSKLEYDNGELFWRAGSQKYAKTKCRAGSDSFNNRGNNVRKVGGLIPGKYFGEHRLIWIMHYGDYPEIVDHMNGNTEDNRIKNLRGCSKQQNNWNSKPTSRSKSKVRGVYWKATHGKFCASIMVDGKKIHLGHFDDLSAAESAREAAEENYFGEFSYYRRPKC